MTNQPLSKLQKYILTLAEQQEYVCYKDVLQSWYGFIPNRMTFRQNQSAFTNHDHVRKEISTARVGICKAFGCGSFHASLTGYTIDGTASPFGIQL